MIDKTKMIHIRMPVRLLNMLDEFLKKSNNTESRSSFIIKAIEEQIKKEKFKNFINTYAGALSEEDAPHWKNDESIKNWLDEIRKTDTEAFENKWKI